MTFTPGNWLARFGFGFGLIGIVGFTQVLDSFYEVKINRWILAILLIVIISTEAYTTNSSILVWVFLGWTIIKDKKTQSIRG